jgi:glucose/arabinose dehydrogenase
MRKFNFLILVFFIVSFTCSRCSKADLPGIITIPGSDTNRTVITGLQYPWEILWGLDNHIWMTERGGKISKVNPATSTVVFSATIAEVVSNNEGGLLGMVQHPGFLTNGLFYVVYNYNAVGGYREKVVQMKFENGNIQPVNTLIENIPASGIHNGSRLWISSDAIPKIFMTTGDAANQPSAQSTSSVSGKVLRFNLDGSIPADNPIAGSPIWSIGHRNQQGLVMANGIMYASEHGPNIEDEVNIIEKNRNYGWPTVNGPCDQPAEITFCNANNVKEPVWSSGSSTIAVCGMDYYNRSLIPAWQNSLLMCTLKDASLRVLTLSSNGLSVVNQQTFFKNSYGRLRDICISPAGKVYLCTSNGGNADVLVEISKP